VGFRAGLDVVVKEKSPLGNKPQSFSL